MIDYQKMIDKFTRVNELLLAGNGKDALVEINKMLQKNIFIPEEMWRVYQRIGDCYFNELEIEKAQDAFWKCLNSTAGFPLIKQQVIYSDYLFILHYRNNISDQELVDKHFMYSQLFAHHKRYQHFPYKHKKIRIGYIADKFIMNVLSFFALHLLTAYDKERFSIYIYSLLPEEDLLTEELQQHVTKWINFPAGMYNSHMAEKIKQDEIDILFDLSMHTYGGRTLQIMSYKPAPIQMAGIGYMSTTGLQDVDYFLTDKYLDPLGEHDEFFCEQLIRLPHSHFCYTPPARFLDCQSKWHPHNPIVFACFNNFAKISNEMLVVWKRILDAVPGSKIILKNGASKSWFEKIITKRVVALGYKKDQYIIEGGGYEYFDRYMDVDIALDTYPYEGGATTCDALLCGVPVISIRGTRHGTRFGYSLLANVGLDDLAVPNLEAYVQKAVELAYDGLRLKEIHTTLPKIMPKSPLMDGNLYVHSIEQEYMRIYDRWQGCKRF